MINYRGLFILIAILMWPALAYAHGGLEAFVIKLAVVVYIIPAAISLYILRSCPRIVWLAALIFSIASAIIIPFMFYTAWWRFAQSALFTAIFWMPLVALLIRSLFVEA